jgi:hypothetical protein
MRVRGTISIVAIATAVLLLIAALFVWRVDSSKFVPAPLPVPNGYAELIQAGQLMRKETSDFNKLSPADLRQWVAGNTNALQIARLGLSKKVQVPVVYSLNYSTNHAFELIQLRLIARGFAAESKLAELEQRTNDGARSALDTIRLGTECPRGGILLDGIMGTVIEKMGIDQLKHFTAALDAKSCREIARELEDLDAQRQTWEDLLDHEHYWSRQTFPGWNYTIARIFMSGQMKALEAKGKTKFIAQEINFRKLLIELAARAYELEKGHRPNSPRDLAPEYLKVVPQDSTTGTNFTYLP